MKPLYAAIIAIAAKNSTNGLGSMSGRNKSDKPSAMVSVTSAMPTRNSSGDGVLSLGESSIFIARSLPYDSEGGGSTTSVVVSHSTQCTVGTSDCAA